MFFLAEPGSGDLEDLKEWEEEETLLVPCSTSCSSCSFSLPESSWSEAGGEEWGEPPWRVQGVSHKEVGGRRCEEGGVRKEA